MPSAVLVAVHVLAAAKLDEHTQLVIRSNTHGPVAVPSRGGCSGGEGGESGGEGGEGGSEGGGEGGEGGEGGKVVIPAESPEAHTHIEHRKTDI